MSTPLRALSVVAVAALALGGCATKPAEKTTPPPSVSTIVATNGVLVPTATMPGLIAPFANVAISSTLTEPTLVVNVHEGERVSAGEVLAVLDTSDLRAELAGDLAQAQSDAASATHTEDQGRLTIAQSRESVQNASATVVQARQTLAKDTLDLNRYEALLAHGYVSQQQVAQQIALVNNDRAAVSSALATQGSANEQVSANGSITDITGLQSSSVEQALATRKVALAQADQIRTMIAKATIVSPIDGVVVNRNLNPGEYPGTRQIFTIQQVDPIYAVLRASGSQVAYVGVGNAATVVATDLRDAKRTGRVAGVLNQVNPGSTDFQIKVELQNADRRLRPGMAVSSTVALPPLRGVRVPVAAFLDDNHDTVMVVDGNSTVKTTKVSEVADDGTTAVVTGLPSGSRVIANGQTSVGDGQKVAVR